MPDVEKSIDSVTNAVSSTHNINADISWSIIVLLLKRMQLLMK